ncbi:MAG: RraA family protein [Clostridia bacterium]|nr:RraA family protein [Clostridia bacterium]MDY6184453.1 RraA family protein [Eubacteriales bacterium]
MKFSAREDIIALTPQWKGERFPDGRPRVADKYLKKLEEMTLEEIWKPIFVKGYESQFEGRLQVLHDDGRKLIGRAVTATFCPTRPDLHEVTMAEGAAEGRHGTYNQWVIDSLVEGDVAVIDMYDKIYKGTFVGGNLTTAIHTRTKTGGAIIWGGIRDTEQMKKIDTQVYYRGIDPTPIREFELVSFNGVTRIGQAVCLPGDVVFGGGGGVLFIPSHLVAEVVDGGAKTHVKDDFGFEMITSGKFTTAQIDKATWTEEMLDMLLEWIKTDPRGEKYRDLDWTAEYDAARNGDPTDTQSAL